ncbi:hypothetical protein RJ639_016984 [Escallonia herrerae]|uniref:Transmembrane protein n=1 Tax=Escallonia herrerae TaxID=1293975 RepID=A0AA88VDX5_9ASTE|nr:hypothetical protein RJ639_016984 [Escallonia herrerae]
MPLNEQWISSWHTTWLLLPLIFCYCVQSSNNAASESVDGMLNDHGFRTIVHQRPHTGDLFEAALPANFAGMKVSVVRLRSRTLWSKGANFSSFRIPSRTLPTPYVRRLFLVYQDFGNWSSHYYGLPGYTLISSVVGFVVYDASNLTAEHYRTLELNITGTPISIQFPNLTFPGGTMPKTKCAKFGPKGKVSLSEASFHNVCYSTSQGHFSIVAPLAKKQGVWHPWVVELVLGLVLLVSASVVGKVVVQRLKVNKIQKMERQADEDEILATTWVGDSKMPSATSTIKDLSSATGDACMRSELEALGELFQQTVASQFSCGFAVQQRQKKMPEPRSYDGTREARQVDNFFSHLERYFEALDIDEEKVQWTVVSQVDSRLTVLERKVNVFAEELDDLIKEKVAYFTKWEV